MSSDLHLSLLLSVVEPCSDIVLDYAVVAFAIVLIISSLQWFFDGRKNYKGPHIEIGEEVIIPGESMHNEMGIANGNGRGNGYVNGNPGVEVGRKEE